MNVTYWVCCLGLKLGHYYKPVGGDFEYYNNSINIQKLMTLYNVELVFNINVNEND